MSLSEFDKQQERVNDLLNQLYAIIKKIDSIVNFIEEETLNKNNSLRKFKIKVNKNCKEIITWYNSDIYNLTRSKETKTTNLNLLKGYLLLFKMNQSEVVIALTNSYNSKSKLEYFLIFIESINLLDSLFYNGMETRKSIYGISDDLLNMKISLTKKSKTEQNKLIQQLVNDLIKYNYLIESDYQQIFNLFSGDSINHKINWVKDINSLGFFMFELNKANLFDEKVSKRIWKHVINCFVVNNEPLLNTKNIKSNHNPKSSKIILNLNLIISKLL